MPSTPNWTKLYREGRCKAIGVPWNDEEKKAIYEHEIPVEYVRDGILTPDEYTEELQKERHKGAKKITHMGVDELQAELDEFGVEYSQKTPRSDLMHMVSVERKKEAKEEETSDSEPSQEEGAPDEDDASEEKSSEDDN